MNARRDVVGIAVLFALFASTLGSTTASASGTTAFKCLEGGGSHNTNAHCDPGTTGTYGHVAVSPGTPGLFTDSNLANAAIQTVLAGVAVEVVCTSVMSGGTLTNKEAGGEMFGHGTEISIEFSGCTVSKPAGQGCKVSGGKFVLPNVTSSTTVNASGEMVVKYTPTSGETFGEIALEGCKAAFLNMTLPLKGSFTSAPSGGTRFMNASLSLSLRWGPASASLTMTLTELWSGIAGDSVSYTTVP
jgi:hypothetical protein